MSKHDYTKHSKPQESEVKPVEPVVTEETPAIEDAVVDPVTPASTVETKEDDKEIIGVVVKCEKLNVRKEPASDAEVLTTIPKGAELQIDISESTENFYKVCTGAGIEGYCVKDYISID